MTSRFRSSPFLKLLLVTLLIAYLGLSANHKHWIGSKRLQEIEFRCADSLMEHYAGQLNLNPRLAARLDAFAQLGRYREANRTLPPPPPNRIVLYGDSLTDYWIQRAPETFLPGRPALDRGISGQATPELLWRFQQDALDLHPTTLVLLAGTNDIVLDGLHISQHETQTNLTRMIERARQQGIRVVLCSLLPVAYSHAEQQQRVTTRILALNAWLRSYAAANHLIYVDYFSAVATPDLRLNPDLALDPLHPNAAGYRIMQQVLEQALDTPH